ncbi:XF1762 family protein [Polaromonas naphthalenivorans]|uniref:Uncharacterized protein n=1 Tax=Polaromonas naphthalenivorans (strain CJ2) TaxID=365044 RepID=A1VVK6_POLNA|nr:XF1762 family protein [Polaromonas naphthalenivorans]ABM39684.1 hypothetical protein Pnap_4406 [Polaromonas naphthalenivorans CJ2]
MALPQEACPYCGEAELIEILEVWPPRDFQLDTCCHGVHEAAVQFLSENPRAAAQWLRAKGLEGLTGRRVRRVIDDGSGQLVLDWRLTIAPVSFSTAKNFVAPHHRHCPAPAGWRFWTGIFNGDELIGCVMVGRPVARALDPARVVEVNRLCVRTDIAPELPWNACSQLYGWAAREARKRGFQRIITYTLESESGVSLKAAGWTIEHKVKGRSWDTPSRRLPNASPGLNKNRWTPES